MQHLFDFADPAVEEASYDSPLMRRFVSIDLGREPALDEIMVCNFSYLLESNNLGDPLFVLINTYVQKNRLKISIGTIVDATIIDAPISTKNRVGEQNSKTHQTRKDNQWYSGMKGNVGVESPTKLIHLVAATPANVHDSQSRGDLLHGGAMSFANTHPVRKTSPTKRVAAIVH